METVRTGLDPKDMEASNAKGEINKDIILKYIIEHPGESGGRIQKNLEINGKPRFSRETIYVHIRELMQERKVRKIKKLYYPTDADLTHIFKFSQHMKRALKLIIDQSLVDSSPDDILYNYSTDTTADKELRAMLCGITTSPNYVKTKFSATESDHKDIFEFVNRTGAYITYLLIESIRPLLIDAKNGSRKASKKDKFASKLVRNSIDIDAIVDLFFRYFDLPYLHYETSNEKLDEKRFIELNKSFSQLYPHVYEGIEKYWSDSVLPATKFNTSLAKEVECNHSWEEFQFYKIDQKYYLCRNCGISSLTRVKYEPTWADDLL